MILVSKLLSRYRALWHGFGYIMGLFAILQGVGYAFEGNAQVTTPSLHVLETFPGHMHTHGFLMLVIGFLLIMEMRASDPLSDWLEDRGLRWAEHLMLKVCCGYASVVSLTIFGSWYITGRVIFAAPWFWIALAAFSGLMITYPPPPLSVLRQSKALAAEERQGDRA